MNMKWWTVEGLSTIDLKPPSEFQNFQDPNGQDPDICSPRSKGPGSWPGPARASQGLGGQGGLPQK